MTVYLVELEPVETRYTAQWKEHLPTQLAERGLDVVVIEGPKDTPQDTTPGAFLNFSGTNYWKSEQLKTISQLFATSKVKDGDYFLYTDAWNPTVIQLKYMSSLLGVNIKIGGLWHAGSYDPQDFLGRLIGDAPWVRSAEHSMFSCYDHNFYASDFHIGMFVREIFQWNKEDWTGTHYDANSSIKRVGWPMEYLSNSLNEYKGLEKKNMILFPHRIAPEKQVDIFRDLAESMPEYEFIVCQDRLLSKDEYHTLLGEAKLVFSANLQETLGISWYEGALVDAIPMVPDRLSYSEMAEEDFKYPSDWTIDYEHYKNHKDEIMNRIREYIENYDSYKTSLNKQVRKLTEDYFSGDAIYNVLKETQDE